MPSRADLVSTIRLKTGYPERGSKGTARIQDALKHALQEMWGDMPEGLLQEEWRFRLETGYKQGTLAVHGTDPLAFVLSGHTTNPSTDGTLVGRWIEILRDGVYHYRRVRDVYVTGQPATWYIIVDKPWDNNTDSGLTYAIFTYDYPYPGDVQKVRSVIRDPENQAIPLVYTVLPNTGDEIRLRRGWRNSGDPRVCQRGDFHQEPPPHYTPTVSAPFPSPLDNQKWGFDGVGAGTQQPSYGQAGTFSYRVCHVWGRRVRPGVTQENALEPFYMSAPSPASAQQSTTWGSSYIQVVTPDIHYLYGYGPTVGLPSYHHYGVEKWIFRARHASEAAGSGGATHQRAEDDGVYYLWRIAEGHSEIHIDRGDNDPVDKGVQLYTNNGHFSLRFDSRAVETDDVLLRVVRRPTNLEHDADTPRIPPESTDALIFLACSYLVGERDGNANRTAFYRTMYDREMEKMRSLANVGSFVREGFHDGISATGHRSFGLIPGTIQEG